jgi:hypothetical protein
MVTRRDWRERFSDISALWFDWEVSSLEVEEEAMAVEECGSGIVERESEKVR